MLKIVPPLPRPSRAGPAALGAVLAALALCFSLGGCPASSTGPVVKPGAQLPLTNPTKLGVIEIPQTDPVARSETIEIGAAQNETVSFALQVSNLPKLGPKSSVKLRLQPLQATITRPADEPAAVPAEGGDGNKPSGPETVRIPAEQYSAYQVLQMPVDVNRAGYVRQTGFPVSADRLPRALLPVPSPGGVIDLAALRDPARPFDAAARVPGGGDGEAVWLWIDLAVPPGTKAGQYAASCEVIQDGQTAPSPVSIKVTVYDFVIPDERHLQMVGRVDWDTLVRLYPELFETVTPSLMTRAEPKYAENIKVLDGLVKLGQQHRTSVVVPRLQPVVKWPAGKPVEVYWDGFDSVAGPWLKGESFADHVPVGYWPLPACDFLDRYNAPSQAQYWSAAASHFDQLDWLKRSPILLDPPASGKRADTIAALELSQQASALLAVHPHLRVTVPIEEGQIQFKSPQTPSLFDPQGLDRLTAAAPSLVSTVPTRSGWPKREDGSEYPHPAHWLRTDLQGLVPYVGAGGDERDVRLWAWLSFLRRASVIQWNGGLPSYSDRNQPADPNELIWFYPGKWFGTDDPVPTVQLKWLRRAEQDFEYLYLAKERGEVINALVMARLITKPVEILPNQNPDPTYALMCGTASAQAWRDVQELLAQTILLRPPGKPLDSEQQITLNVKTKHWTEPLEKPFLVGRTTLWGWGLPKPGGNWVDLRLGVDIYNAQDDRLTGELKWNAAPVGWEFAPQPIDIGLLQAINVFNVARYPMEASVNLDKIGPQMREPVSLSFTNALDPAHRVSTLRLMLPVATSDKLEGHLSIDGNLSDWDAADALQDGPLVQMFNRPAMQRQDLQLAATKSQVYSGWAVQNFYVAFRLEGIAPPDAGRGRVERNDVDYQFRRAWGEDLCELLIQPVYMDPKNPFGSVLHVVCKPSGQVLVETRQNPRLDAGRWQPVLGAAVRYAAATEYGKEAAAGRPAKPQANVWRGEIALPWNAINDADHAGVRPALLRFNFVQHRTTTGESASWAGPIDFGRDESLMGLLYLREGKNPGMGSGVKPEE